MSFGSTSFVVDRIELLRQLVGHSNGRNEDPNHPKRELDRLVRILRPNSHQANDHSNAIRLRLRQAILNNPNAGSEGPLLLSKFDKTCDALKKVNPALLGPILAFLKPLSFKAPAARPGVASALDLERRLDESVSQTAFVQSSRLAHSELQLAVAPSSQIQSLDPVSHTTAALSSTELLPAHRQLSVVGPDRNSSETTNICWVAPDIERKIIVDLIYILQGVMGKYIKYDARSESYIIDPALHLPATARDMTLSICELGWLYAKVSAYLTRIFGGGATDSQGLVVQAFGFALQEELQDYYRLLAVLEQEISKQNLVTAAPLRDSEQRFQSKDRKDSAPTNAVETATQTGLTLLRLKAWMQEPIERMCLMARLVDGVSNLTGGALISRLHAHSRHGDEEYARLIRRILDSVCAPIDNMLTRWLLHGELNDPHREFFVIANQQHHASSYHSTAAVVRNQNLPNNLPANFSNNLWREAYLLREELLPNFLPPSLAFKMLMIGRSINFIKLCLQRLPKEAHLQQKGRNNKARKSLRMINKSKKLTMYGRVVDEYEEGNTHKNDDNATDIGAQSSSTALVTASNAGRNGSDLPHHKAVGRLTQQQKDEAHFLLSAFEGVTAQEIQQALHTLRHVGDLELSAFVHRLAYHIDTRLMHLLDSRFHYRQHLLALKRFLLLGQGDFVLCLMDAVGPELKKRANQLFRHNLTAMLEGALRSSNAQYDPAYILDRVNIRLLDAAPGDSGWEVFSLDYVVDIPLNAIAHSEAMAKYRIAFHMLWRLKRVEWSLTTTWKAFLSFAHSHDWKVHQLSQSKLQRVKLPAVMALKSIFHRCNLYRAQMLHFINNLCAFVMFEVLETSWVQLEERLDKAQSLEHIIAAHDRYLDEILDRSLLSSKYELLNGALQALLQTILRFCSLEETLVADAMALVARQKMLLARSTDSYDEQDHDRLSAADDGVPATLVSRIEETVRDYTAQFDALMSALRDQGEKDSDILRYLTFRLDFNDFHSSGNNLANNTGVRPGAGVSVMLGSGGGGALASAAPVPAGAKGYYYTSTKFTSSTVPPAEQQARSTTGIGGMGGNAVRRSLQADFAAHSS